MKTNYKNIRISTLIFFFSLTGLSPAAEQYGGEFENDYYRNGTNTRVEVHNYYGNYGSAISYAARINRFHRPSVSVYYYSGYNYYYTPFWDNWYYFREMAYYDYRVSVFYNPWPYYYRTRAYYSFYYGMPVYYRSNYNWYRSTTNYCNSNYRAYYSNRYSRKTYNSGYYSHNKGKYPTSNRGENSYSKGGNKKYSSNSMVNRNKGKSQANSVAVSNKRRSQNHFVSNPGTRNNRSQVKSEDNNWAKTLSSSDRRSAGSLNKKPNSSKVSANTSPVSNSYNNRRAVSHASFKTGVAKSRAGSSSIVKAKRVVNGRSGTFSGTSRRNVSVHKSTNFSNRSNATKQIASAKTSVRSQNPKTSRNVEQKNQAKTRSASGKNSRR